MSKGCWKNLVRKHIESITFTTLVEEAASMTKTSSLKYTKLAPQPYLTMMDARDVFIIFRARLQTISCKGNMPGSYRNNLVCRLCGEDDETQEHVANCSEVRGSSDLFIDVRIVYDLDAADPGLLGEMCTRFRTFNELIVVKT